MRFKSKITIFTKAYNNVDYIESCIQSVLNQTYSEFTYLILDNGSTDGTSEIIQKYAESDDRINVIKYAKNDNSAGLNIIKDYVNTPYVAVLDSDDILVNTFLEKTFILAIENDLDLVIASNVTFNEDKPCNIAINKHHIVNQSEFPKYFKEYYLRLGQTWGKVIKYNLFINEDTLSRGTMLYAGDRYLVNVFISKAKRIGFVEDVLYNYRINQQSVSYTFLPKRIDDIMRTYRHTLKVLNDIEPISESNSKYLDLSVAVSVMLNICRTLKSNVDIQKKVLFLDNIVTDNKLMNLLIINKDIDDILYNKFLEFKKDTLNYLLENNEQDYYSKYIEIINEF